MNNYIEQLKKDTNNLSDIIYREKIISKKKVWIIYNEPLINSDKVSDFIIKSLTELSEVKIKNLYDNITNNIYNYKIQKVNSYDNLCKYLHKGFTIILIDEEKDILVLETKGNIKRSITTPNTENSFRGPKDSFIEDYQTNVGLIRKRIKNNNLWIKNMNIGKYTDTQIGILYINGICKEEIVDRVIKKLEGINTDGILSSGILRNEIENDTKIAFPTILSTERPDRVCNSLLLGKVCILVDNDPYILILPTVLDDFFKTSEDYYSKSINATFNRIIRYLSFFIALFVPAIYIALITYNQEMLPTELLINFSIQRNSVPFPAFFETFIMMISFEILRESDLRTPSFTGSSLSIVGALILGDAAVAAGIVSPILIIVIALTGISSLPFNELEVINSLRWYRILFMIAASLLGVIGIVICFLYFLINLCTIDSYGVSYLSPYVPTNIVGLKDSIVKFPIGKVQKRPRYLSKNRTRGTYEG